MLNDSSSSIIRLLDQEPHTLREGDISILVNAITDNQLDLITRVRIGEFLSLAGDPRLLTPGDDGYWTLVTRKEISLLIGRFMVTTSEWRQFIAPKPMPTTLTGVKLDFVGVIQSVHLGMIWHRVKMLLS